MKRGKSAAERMLKGMNKGAAARRMLGASNKFAKQMRKRLG